MSKPVVVMDDDEAQELLRGSAALEIELVDALVERDPLPEELAPDELSRCKYLSKKCLRQRATKAKGEPHKLCTFHRAKAILNQRRLERRKRERVGISDDAVVELAPTAESKSKSSRSSTSKTSATTRRSTSAIQAVAAAAAQAPRLDGAAPKRPPSSRKRRKPEASSATAATALVMLPAINVSDVSTLTGKTEPSAKRLSVRRGTLSPRDVQDLEPYRTPATLFPEDLEALRGLVDLDIADVEPLAWDFCF